MISMEISNERITILKLLEDKGVLSSEEIEKETGLPRERTLEEIRYLELMEQIECSGKVFSGNISDIRLRKEGLETLERNRNLWKKISSKIKGFNISILGTGVGINF